MKKLDEFHKQVPATLEIDEMPEDGDPTPPRPSFQIAGFVGGWIIGPLAALTVIAALCAAIAFFVRLIIG
jgi:hypothetical protein